METNAAGQNLAQAMEDGFHRRLLDESGGHIEQGSIPTVGGRHAYIIFRHVHQTSTEQPNRKPIANTSAVDVCLVGPALALRSLPTCVLGVRGFQPESCYLTFEFPATVSDGLTTFIPIYPNRLPTVPKPPRACRTPPSVIISLERSKGAITRLENR